MWRRLNQFLFLQDYIAGEQLFMEETGQTRPGPEEAQIVANLIGWTHQTWQYTIGRLHMVRTSLADTPVLSLEEAEKFWAEAEQQHLTARRLHRGGLPEPEPHPQPLPPIPDHY